jgi:hypothetical protein
MVEGFRSEIIGGFEMNVDTGELRTFAAILGKNESEGLQELSQ